MDDGAELIAAMRRSRRVGDDGHPMTPDDGERRLATDSAPGGMMTLEEAVAAQAQMRRAQRALP